jgi:hypothetical protein
MSYAYRYYQCRRLFQTLRPYFVALASFILGVLFYFAISHRVRVEIVQPIGAGTNHTQLIIVATNSATLIPTATPTPQPIHPTTHIRHSYEEVRDYIRSKPWDYKTAEAIVSCESSWIATNKGKPNRDGTIDIGLFGINSIHGWTEAESMDAIKNVDQAFTLYLQAEKRTGNGWQPWYPSFNRGCVAANLASL